MRITIGIVLVILIIGKSVSSLAVCNIQTAKQAIPPRIHFEQTIDGPAQRTLVTRILHNKVVIFLSEFGRCYLSIYEPAFIFKSVGLFGLIFWFYLVYKIIDKKNWPLIALLIILPIFPFFNFANIQIPYIHKLFAIIGAILFANKR